MTPCSTGTPVVCLEARENGLRLYLFHIATSSQHLVGDELDAGAVATTGSILELLLEPEEKHPRIELGTKMARSGN